MAHSIYDYLCRQSTEKLQHIQKLYIEDEQSELNKEVIRLVTKVLDERAAELDLHFLQIIQSPATGLDLHFLPPFGEEN